MHVCTLTRCMAQMLQCIFTLPLHFIHTIGNSHPSDCKTTPENRKPRTGDIFRYLKTGITSTVLAQNVRKSRPNGTKGSKLPASALAETSLLLLAGCHSFRRWPAGPVAGIGTPRTLNCEDLCGLEAVAHVAKRLLQRPKALVCRGPCRPASIATRCTGACSNK